MSDPLKNILKKTPVEASAPCRIDMGGTLDINTFGFPLKYLTPCTFNIALNMRTYVRLLPFEPGMVRISSIGFDDAIAPIDAVPFNHPMGLMFAIAAYYRTGGVHIDIRSTSPPRSALGGSSVAAVALIFALEQALGTGEKNARQVKKAALLAHALEQSVAGVPCGMQDQLAAAFGGVNAWYWTGRADGHLYTKKSVVKRSDHKKLENHLLLAYCGIPHESRDINGRWVRQFLSGENRNTWVEIIGCTKKFVEALSVKNYKDACVFMNRETAIRRSMTPDVLDEMGEQLVDAATENRCGARFTGAGGGGCIWAIGEKGDIGRLKGLWETQLSKRKEACLLPVSIDGAGVVCERSYKRKRK